MNLPNACGSMSVQRQFVFGAACSRASSEALCNVSISFELGRSGPRSAPPASAMSES